MASTNSKPANALTELDLLTALIYRTTREAARRGTTGSGILKIITNDSRLWVDMQRRQAFLDARARNGSAPQTGEKTRSMSLELRDRVRDGLVRLEQEKVQRAATAA